MTEDQLQEIINSLYEKCSVCDGSGKNIESIRRDLLCYQCDGKGKVVSWIGEQLISFIADNINVSLKR